LQQNDASSPEELAVYECEEPARWMKDHTDLKEIRQRTDYGVILKQSSLSDYTSNQRWKRANEDVRI
jgi:hypothetical protein